MPTITDNNFEPHWVERAQQGDMAAQRAIYLHFAPQIQRLARHILQCETAAEEVVQDCFVDLLSKIDRFRHQGSFAGWLRRIAVNRCLMTLRSGWNKKRTQLDDFDLLEAESRDEIDHQALNALNKIMAQLPAKTRAVLWLHDVEDYTHGEIAKLMGQSVSFSKSQLARAHDKIRQQLDSSREPKTKALDGENLKIIDSGLPETEQSGPEKTNSKDGVESCMPLLNNY